ncbi:ACT domain protein [Thermosulfidibacter takaii ABI70S6]|uniref:ACT domain protein n=1 Tax=Thermosulfidibacter takaii (strain DSM 17441 / JCM 13301 / NBRC 103674 / ABI70S6) TaxID=1298851 RepID=A0A0S3QSJ6_THET7|nr:ACT domain protein [Thermosulfidibacter takaii ABI70S6]
MKVEQISVFLENKAGRLAEVAEILGKNGINIRALSLADTTDFGILRLIVNDRQKTKEVLKNAGFTVGITEVVAVEVEDEPGGLAKILTPLAQNGINVEYMYAFVEKSRNKAVLIFKFENIDKAIEVLKANKVTVLSGEQVYSL